MHGRLKVKTDSQKQLEKQKERQEKANQFLTAKKNVFQMRIDGKTDKEALEITGQLVAVNPDFYTIWNYRREILLFFMNNCKSNEDSKQFAQLCRNELQLTENCLRVNPKSYCVWHQRSWIIKQMPNPDLKMEIALCNQCLQLDERNFLCWDYRRFVSKLAKTEVSEELKFTLKKIEQNFSNFSSWYYRSCLFTSAANKGEIDFTNEWKREYDLVENAIFTDPSDQSAWFYHKWLVSTNQGHKMMNMPNVDNAGHVLINRIVLNLTQRQLIIHTSRPLKHKPLVTVSLDNEFLMDIQWNSSKGINSSIWFAQVSANQFSNLSINPCPTFAPNPEYIEPLNISSETNEHSVFVWERNSSKIEKQIALEDSYLKSLRELHKLEPNNKWVNLTLAWNDPKYTKMDNLLEALIKLDPLRVNYYNDLKSKTALKERADSMQLSDSGELNQLKLSAVYDFDRLSHIRCLDLSDNNLLKLSKAFNNLISLEILVIDSNKIYAIDKDLELNKLRILSLNKNKISESKVVINLKNLLQLETLMIKDNPISKELKGMSNSDLSLKDRTKIITDSDSNQCPDIDVSASKLKVVYNLF